MDVQARIQTDVCLYFCLAVCCTLSSQENFNTSHYVSMRF